MCVMTLVSRITNTCDPPQLRTRDMAYTRLCVCVCVYTHVCACMCILLKRRQSSKPH